MINPLLICSPCRWDRCWDCELLGCQCPKDHSELEDE
jgi:hypothetical protein